MNIPSVITDAAAENGGIITNKTAEEKGISRAVLSILNKKGALRRIARGQYVLADSFQDELLSVTLRSAHLVLSHETALWLHGISDRTPFVHSVTVPSGRMPTGSVRDECKIYYVKPELFDLGKTTLSTPFGNTVPSYDLERTICDCVRSRNRMSTETFLNAMKEYAARNDKDLNRLYAYAEKFRVTSVIRTYLEVLL